MARSAKISRPPVPPQNRALAVLSDIHGNLQALDAVLAQLAASAVSDVCVLGDLLLGGQDPLAVWQRLRDVKARCLRGASDTALYSVRPEALRVQTEAERLSKEAFLRTREQIGELVLAQLKRLPDKLRIPLADGREILAVHGSPKDPLVEISHEMSDEEIQVLLDDDPASIVVVGATHVPFQRQLETVQLINVGSVGQSPEGAVAHYTILTPGIHTVQVDQSWVNY